MCTQIIHHYTSIDTLELILLNRKIRFSRLDTLDDINESKAYGFHDFSGFLYVSCWTDLLEESIPQWKMYGDSMRGVMITLPKSFFNFQPFIPPPNVGMTVNDNIKFPVNWNEIFSDEYWLQMIFLYESWFGTKVQYVDNIVEIFNRNITLTRNTEGREILNIEGLNTFASFKQKEWLFQSEHRFILCAFPPLVFPPGGFNNADFVEKYSIHHVNCIKSKNYPSIKHIDIHIDSALNQAKFTLGPKSDEKDMSRLIALTKKYAPSATVCKSKFSDTIR